MNQTASLGSNRTGTATAPERLQEMLTGMAEFLPAVASDGQNIAQLRVVYAQEVGPSGSVPPPSGIVSTVQTAVKSITGGQPTVFLDKLGARMGFERAGVRLYEALVSKHQAFGGFTGGPSQEDLIDILREEYAHFMMLKGVIEQVGGDPTAVTPSADLEAVLSQGPAMALTDPHITLLQSLEATLVIELTDNECWLALSQLATIAGEEQLAQQFRSAYQTEQEHLEKVRCWVAVGQGRGGYDGSASA
jgi:hypothetical protein